MLKKTLQEAASLARKQAIGEVRMVLGYPSSSGRRDRIIEAGDLFRAAQAFDQEIERMEDDDSKP